MSEREAILLRLRQALPSLNNRYPIKSLGLFGSYARDDASASSDLDILVQFSAPVSLSRFLALEAELSALTGHTVDLVSSGALKPHIGVHVMQDLVAL